MSPGGFCFFGKAQLHATGYNPFMNFLMFKKRLGAITTGQRIVLLLLEMVIVGAIPALGQTGSPAEAQFQVAIQAMREGKLEEAAQGFAAAAMAAPTFAEAYF